MSRETAFVILFIIIIIIAIIVIIVIFYSTSPTVPPPGSNTIDVITAPIVITQGSQLLASVANPKRTITQISAVIQDTAMPPTIGVTISLHEGPTADSNILAVLRTTSAVPTTVTSVLTSQPAASTSTLYILSSYGPGSNTDLGIVSAVRLTLG